MISASGWRIERCADGWALSFGADTVSLFRDVDHAQRALVYVAAESTMARHVRGAYASSVLYVGDDGRIYHA